MRMYVRIRARRGIYTGEPCQNNTNLLHFQGHCSCETMAAYMLKHDGNLNRWCPVQVDVEEYFRKTLPEVSVAFPCATRMRECALALPRAHGTYALHVSCCVRASSLFADLGARDLCAMCAQFLTLLQALALRKLGPTQSQATQAMTSFGV